MVGVYTGAAVQDGRLGAMHMERVPARIVPRCKDLKMNISTGVAQWQLVAPVPAGSPLVVGPAPVVTTPNSTWATPGGANWVGSSDWASVPGKYTFELSFCLGSTFQNAKTSLDASGSGQPAKLWADNQADLSLNGSLVAGTVAANPPAPNDPGLDVAITTGFIVGTNTLKVVVRNMGTVNNPFGMLLKGWLSANQADCGS